MMAKMTLYDTAKENYKTAREALGAAERALNQNRDPDMLDSLMAALNQAKAAYDTADMELSEKQFMYDKIREQQQADHREWLEEQRVIAEAERAGREEAMNHAVTVHTEKMSEK